MTEITYREIEKVLHVAELGLRQALDKCEYLPGETQVQQAWRAFLVFATWPVPGHLLEYEDDDMLMLETYNGDGTCQVELRRQLSFHRDGEYYGMGRASIDLEYAPETAMAGVERALVWGNCANLESWKARAAQTTALQLMLADDTPPPARYEVGSGGI